MRQILRTPTNESDDDCDGLNIINYPMEDSSTIRHLMRQYGFDSSHDGMDGYTENDEDPSQTNDNYTITMTNTIDQSGTTTIESSTMGGPSSFPDLSYNQFQTPIRTASASLTNDTI